MFSTSVILSPSFGQRISRDALDLFAPSRHFHHAFVGSWPKSQDGAWNT